jgi:hypothetical protein
MHRCVLVRVVPSCQSLVVYLLGAHKACSTIRPLWTLLNAVVTQDELPEVNGGQCKAHPVLYDVLCLGRLPVESARKLRWYEHAELPALVRGHLREKRELQDCIAAMKKVCVLLLSSSCAQMCLGTEMEIIGGWAEVTQVVHQTQMAKQQSPGNQRRQHRQLGSSMFWSAYQLQEAVQACLAETPAVSPYLVPLLVVLWHAAAAAEVGHDRCRCGWGSAGAGSSGESCSSSRG